YGEIGIGEIRINQTKEENPRWRRLAVVVGPDGVQTVWDGEALPDIARSTIVALEGGMLLPKPEPPGPAVAPYSPRGALGLSVRRGNAYFRNVSIALVH